MLQYIPRHSPPRFPLKYSVKLQNMQTVLIEDFNMRVLLERTLIGGFMGELNAKLDVYRLEQRSGG